MRISAQIVDAFLLVFKKTVPKNSHKSTLYLFGSRTDDSKLGGDIDLLVLTTDEIKKELKAIKHLLLEELRQAAGDQRVDLTIKSAEEAKTDPFVKSLKLIKLGSF